MKKKLWTPLPLFSKRNLKRSKSLFLLIFFISFSLQGEDSSLIADRENKLLFTYSFDLDDRVAVLDSLNKGSAVELILQLRLHRKDSSFLALFDTKICEEEVVYTAKRDFFSNKIAVSDNANPIVFYDNPEDFFDGFLNPETELLPDCDIFNDLSSYYLRFKAILIKRVYVEPFHIFQFVDYGNRISTGWKNIDLKREDNAF